MVLSVQRLKPLPLFCSVDIFKYTQVKEGESLLVPGGWPYALTAGTDALLLGSQMLHSHNLGLQVITGASMSVDPDFKLSIA